MGLDVSLVIKEKITKASTGVFVREDGQNKELTIDELKERFPNYIAHENEYETNEVYDNNITHNLANMADACGLYEPIWNGDKYNKASELIEPLEKGLELLTSNPSEYTSYNPENGWGTYDTLVKFTTSYLYACRSYPNAIIQTF